jgi:putative DNA primase/helicase
MRTRRGFCSARSGETTPASIDTTLGEQLLREGPGILRWLVEGCLAWQRDGLGSAASIEAATTAYRHEQDICSAFLEECTTRTADARTASADLYSAYRAWCVEAGERCWTQRAFVAALQERGLDRTKSGGVMTYRGLGLLADRPGAPPRERDDGRRYAEADVDD